MLAKPFLITGMLRSGTTLVQNSLDLVDGIACSNQGFSSLFFDSKKEFFTKIGIDSYHVLSNYFPASHTAQQFSTFLEDSAFKNEYETKLRQNRLLGNKEVLMEEFLPYLSGHIKIILILRNPLDVITSLHYGNYEKYVGMHRPLLFDIRNWRKSVAFSILLKNNPNVFILKYEELVMSFNKKINEICKFLTGDATEIPDQKINKIKVTLSSNSSFENTGSLSMHSINRFEQHLPEHIIELVNTYCFPEMKYLNYTVKAPPTAFPLFEEPFLLKRKEFRNFNQMKELEREKKRMELLQNRNSKNSTQIREYFIFREVFDALKIYF